MRYDTSSQLLARVVDGRPDPLRHHHSRWRHPVVAPRLGAPRRARVRRSRRLRHRPRDRFEPAEFRQRCSLLPGRPPRPHGGPGRAGRTVQADPRIRNRRGQRRPRPLQQCPRIRPPTHDRGGPIHAAVCTPSRTQACPRSGRLVGIGEATAIELAAHGFPVALGARRVEKLTSWSARSGPTAARPWVSTSTSPIRTR